MDLDTDDTFADKDKVKAVVMPILDGSGSTVASNSTPSETFQSEV